MMTMFKNLFNRRAKVNAVKNQSKKWKVVGFTHAGTPCEMCVEAPDELTARRTAMSVMATDSRAYTTNTNKNWTTKFKGIYYVIEKHN